MHLHSPAFGHRPGARAVRGRLFRPVAPQQTHIYSHMISAPLPHVGANLILRGIHLDLNEATRASIAAKVERLFRHEPRILRVRIDVERAPGGGTWLFSAKGHIEIGGPDLRASVTTEDAHKSVNLLVDKLDRMLRRRTTAHSARRRN